MVAAAFPMRVSETLLGATRSDAPQAIDMINVWSRSPTAAFERKPSDPGPRVYSNVWQNLRLMQRIAQGAGPDVLPLDFAACNAYAGGLDAAKALRCPPLRAGKPGRHDAAPRGPVARCLRRLDRHRTRGRRPFADGRASGARSSPH